MVLCSSVLQALALHTPQLQVSMQVLVYKAGVPQAGLTAAQVAQSPDADFTAFEPAGNYATANATSLWLKLRVRSDKALAANDWLIEFSNIFVDKASLHHLGADGVWASQSAGDWVAHTKWPVRSLKPQFTVPAQQAGETQLLLEVRNKNPMHFGVTLLSVEQARAQDQVDFFTSGGVLGWMLLMAIAGVVIAIAYRQEASIWYALYIFVTMVLVAAYIGIGGYALWPQSTVGSKTSVTVLFMLTMVLQLQFCRAMFITHASALWERKVLLATTVLCTLAIAVALLSSLELRLVIYLAQLGLATVVASTVALRAMARGSLVAKLWVVAYTPIVIICFLSVLDKMGFYAIDWLPYNAPLYALLFEMPMLLLAMHMQAKEKHGQAVRDATLAGTDQSTGFVASHSFEPTLAQLWNDSRSARSDTAVAYIKVSYQLNHVALRGSPAKARTTQRVVRLIRTVARQQDTVAHVDKDLFAIIMPGLGRGDDLSNRLSRLVALAAMTDADAAHDVPIRLHIVASSMRSFKGEAAALHKAMQSKLNQADWGQRAIRYVRKQGVRSDSKPANTETLSQFWQRANDAEMAQTGVVSPRSTP